MRPLLQQPVAILGLAFVAATGSSCVPAEEGVFRGEASSAESFAVNSPMGEGESRSLQAEGPQKRALVVAIGNYPDPNRNGYRPINSLNDVPLITSSLRNQGFPDANVRTVQDGSADRRGILSAMNDLLEQAGPGDVIVFHYSGHGDQLTDDNGDELDGYDEVLVPYGAPSNEYFRREFGLDSASVAAEYASNDDRFQHIRDDELNEYFSELRGRAGPSGNVVVWIDSCHSGTGTRAAGGPMPRGTPEPIGVAATADSVVGQSDQAGLFEEQTRSSQSELAPFVVFSASRQGELSWETRDEQRTAVGPLSLALSRALPDLQAGDSYQALFDRVSILMSAMAPNQLPQIEGDGATAVFSGRAVVQEPYYRVTQVLSDDRIVLDGGRLTGLTEGSRIALYPIGQAPSEVSSPTASGTVELVDALLAEVALDTALLESSSRESWAYVTERAYGDLIVAVNVAGTLGAEVREELVQMLEPNPTIHLSPTAGDADLVVEPVGGSFTESLVLRTAVDGVGIGSVIETNGAWADDIRNRVLGYSRNRYLKQVTMTKPELLVQLDVVPVTHTFVPRVGGVICTDSDPNEPGGAVQVADSERMWQFTEGDGFLLRIRNVGSEPAHVAVLELYPDGNIGQLLPSGSLTADESRLEPGQELLVEDLCFTVAAPYGNYMFKLFATASPINFSPIITVRVSARSAGLRVPGPLGRLLEAAHFGTRSTMAPVPSSVGSTDAVLMRVVPN